MANRYLKFLKKVLKYVISVRTIMLTRLCGGLYYRIGSNKCINIAAKVYCVICAINYYKQIVALLKSIVLSANQIITSVFYDIYLILSLLGYPEEMQLFLNELERVDDLLDVALDTDVPVARILFVGVILERVALTSLWCMVSWYSCHKSLLATVTNATMIGTVMLSGFPRIMMFELTLYRVKALRLVLKNRLSAARQDETEIAREIKHCIQIYKNVLDIFRRIDTPVKIMMFLAMVFVVPKIVVIVYLLHTLDYFGFQDVAVYIILDLFVTCTLLLLPAVIATHTSGEVDRIKILILKQYFVCKGDTNNCDLIDAIQDVLLYMEHCPFKFTVWRLFAVDMSLVVGTISLAITSSLVMVQFAHFYG